MTKKIFLKRLDERLSILNDKERRDLLSEYEAHIDMKIAEGVSEDEAIEGFGDFDELVADLLEAYHVDPDFDNKKKSEDAALSDTLRRIGRFMQASLDSLLDMRREEILSMLGRLAMLAILLFFLMVAISIVEGVLYYPIDAISFPHAREFMRGFMQIIFFPLRLAILIYAIYYFLSHYVIREPFDDRKNNMASARRVSMGSSTDTVSVKNKTVGERQSRRLENDERFIKLFYFVVKVLVVVVFFVPMIPTFAGSVISTVVLASLVIMGWPLIGAVLFSLGIALIIFVMLDFVWGLTFKGGGEK